MYFYKTLNLKVDVVCDRNIFIEHIKYNFLVFLRFFEKQLSF